MCALFATGNTCAAPFGDPFRPPREAQAPSSTAGASDAPRLESVLIAPDRRLAVINGQQYSEGATYRDGRVLRISESEVVIRRPGGDEALKLYPRDVKRASGSADEGK
jgi:MSHA biogenesis protein MshK